jgi:hypothetical protein
MTIVIMGTSLDQIPQILIQGYNKFHTRQDVLAEGQKLL